MLVVWPNESVAEKFAKLRGLYTDTFLEIKAVVCSKVSLEKLKAHIEDLDPDLEDFLQSSHTNREVMKLFRKKKCNFPYFHSLYGLVHGLHLDEAVELINKFAATKEEIYKTIKAKDVEFVSEVSDHNEGVQVGSDERLNVY